ncbi:MAG: hypothetical protein K0Q53_124 [Massilibacillus sp.]|jgi:hypothetical protein|nr:hypothetical protein [Massilibacillus sp.]
MYVWIHININKLKDVLNVNTEEYKQKAEELQKASLPLLGFLNKYYHPHAYAIVTEGRVEIISGEMSTGLQVCD